MYAQSAKFARVYLHMKKEKIQKDMKKEVNRAPVAKKKKILFMSSAKLTALSIGLLLAVFCTIGMSFRPVYDEQEAEEIVMSGPRRSHWTTSGKEGSGCSSTTVTYYNDKKDYAKTESVTLGNGYTTITANSKNATPVNSSATTAGSQSYVLWNTGVTEHAASDKNKTAMSSGELIAAHTNEITFLATPSDPDEYRFAGWYSNAAGTTLVSTDNPYTASVVIPNASYGTKQTTTYESASNPYPTTYYAKFEEIPATNVIFLAASTPARDNGYYTVVGKGVNQTITTSNQTIGVKSITLTAYPSEAAVFVRWYTEDNSGDRTTLSTENTCVVSFDASTKVGIEWKELTNNHIITFKAVDLDANDNPVGIYSISSTELSTTIGASDYAYNTGEAYKFTPTLTANPTAKYMFYGWYTKDGAKKNYLSYDATWTPTLMEDITIYAEFLYGNYTNDELAQFQVGSVLFYDLNLANSAASSGSNKTITLVKDGVLPPGHYTISSGNTLLIPYNSNGAMVTSESNFKNMANSEFNPVSAYRTLTFAKGADLTVDGTLYVAAQHLTSTNVMENASGGPGRPIGPVGRIHMSEGGHIEVNGKLFCFGFITGQNMASGNNTLDVGTITANSGAIVYENFILGDMKGGQATYTMVENSQKVFPFNSYFLQNIEVPITFNYGATEKVVTSFNPSGTNTTSTFTIIGGTNDDAMFRMHAKGATITKWYDATTDHFCVQLSGNSSLENLKLSFSMKIGFSVTVEVDSKDYILPIPSSMHLILDNTDVTLSNALCLLPGAIAEIHNNATLTINTNMYVYDVSQWDKYCLSKYFITYNTPFTNHLVRSTADMSQLDDAKFIIDGTCTINNGKYLYSSSSGANICGNNGGRMIFSGSLPAATNAYQVKGSATGSSSDYDVKISGTFTSDVYLTAIPVAAANLHNENNTYTKSIASTTFHNVHGRWFAGAAKDENASTHVHTFTYRAGENVGTATENMNAGSDATTPAVYSWDKTGVDLRQKWADVSGPVCTNWWQGKGTQSTYFYNWTMSSDWHQFTPMTSPTGWYGGSNNKLYEKSDCTWNEIGDTDENCMYTIGGVKKALVDGALIELEKNTYDEAYHDAATGENFYVCFEGCNWHPATPYPDELEAYIVIVDDTLNYIWKDGEWFNVLHDELMFYTLNEKGTKDYYDYIDNRWQDAQPRVKVVSGDQVWRGFSFLGAITQANEWNDATITVLNDLAGTNVGVTYNRKNSTCTLDLNGHTVSGAVPFTDDNNRGLLKIDASGTTFTITDNSADKEGRIENICNQNKVTYAVHLMAGTLNVEHGTIHAENPAQYASKVDANFGVSETLTACGARGIQVNAAQKLNITGGRTEAFATRNAYGIVASGNNANTTQVTITGGEVYAEAPCGAYGISCSGKLNFSNGLIEAKLNDHLVDASYAADNADNNIKKHQTCYGIYMTGSANKAATSCYFGTLTMTGGTVKATSDVAADYTSNVFGINLYADFAGTGAANTKATDGTLSQKYAAKATIENAKIEVNTKANYGYGIVGYGRYNSADKSTSVIKIKNTEVDVYARAYAYGILSSCRISTGTGNGGCTNADIDLTNCDVYAETTTAEGAYAVWSSATQGAVYEYTYKDGVATATNSIYAGEYAIGANMTVHSGRYEAKTKTSSAYASGTSTKQINTYSRHSGTALYQQLGGQAEEYSTLNIEDGTFIATAGTETARAVSNGGNTTITGGTFQATATTRYAYCIYALSGTLNVSNATITATSKSNTANGIHLEGTVAAYTMFAYAPTATLTNLNVTATTGTGATARALYVTGATRTQTEAQKEALTFSNRNNYYNIYQVGEKAIAPTVTVHGGTYTATAGTSSAYGAHSPGTSISTNKVATASPVMNLYNATFVAQTGTSTSAYGVSAGGPTLIDGCTITATAGNATKYQSTASGVRAVDKTTTIKNSTITATATDAAYGLEGYVEINATHGYCFHGEFDLSEAGNTEVTAEAKTSGKKAYTIYLKSAKKNIASGNFAGDYATAASATINGGTYNAKFTTSGSAYVISLDGKQTQGSVVTQPEVEVLDGFFNGATAEVGTAGVVGHMQLKGGYFVHPTNLATYAVAPKSVWTLPNTHEHYNPYKYKVTEHYTITFKNGTTQLQQNDLETGSTPSYSGTPTKDADAQYTYTYDGWSTTDGGDKLAALPAVAGEATYYAHFAQTENKYSVSVEASANGSVSPASVSGIGCETASADITATPDAGYAFNGWTLPDGVTAATGYTAASNPIRIHAIAADKTITANFVARNDINYTVKHWQQNIADDDYTEVTADQETLQGTTATPTAAAAKSYTGFTALPITQETIAGDGTTVVNIYYNRNTYTITWVDGNNVVIETDENVAYGAIPSFDGTTPTKDADVQYSYTFAGWSPAVASVTKDATYTAKFNAHDLDLHVTEQEQKTINEDVTITTTTVENGGTLTVGNENNEVTLQSTTIIVESGGQLDVADNGSIAADVFIIQATTEEQGDEDAKEEVQVSGELSESGSKNLQAIYYDLTRKHGTENFLARVWYAVAVPWAVEVPTYNNGGVYIKQGENFVQQRMGETFDLITYDGHCRATQGASADCWVYLEDEIAGGADAVMVPGKLYMIYLTEETSTIRFKKKAGEAIPIHTNSLEVTAYAETTSNDGKDANWNGIANPATYKAYMNVAVGGLVQKFVPGTQPRDGGSYLPIDLTNKQSVGQPLFVQVNLNAASTTVQVTRTQNPSASAPRRVQAQSDSEVRYAISIAANGKLADRLYIQTAEEKEDEYIIGKDMSKMSVSSRVAQIWVNRYDSKLCLNTAVLDRDKASYPLGIYAPQAGEYKIFAPADIETNDNIYLTLDGRVIWNLTMAPYYASLEQGTTNRYGLKLVRSNVPAVSTDVENIKDGTYPAAQKIIIEDMVYILRGENLYSIDGQLVK